jgi:hypothetical protein
MGSTARKYKGSLSLVDKGGVAQMTADAAPSSGLCIRYAPSPDAGRSQPTHWRVTHEGDGCGDGFEIEEAG